MSKRAIMDISIQLLFTVILVSTIQADRSDNGPQTFDAKAPQSSKAFKEVIMYLTPAQISNYEAGHGLPNFSKATPDYSYEQQAPEQPTPLNEREGEIVQSTLDILEANRMQFPHKQANNDDLEYANAQAGQNIDVRPIEEPNTEAPPERLQVSIGPQQLENDQNRLREPSSTEREQVAQSYSYVQFLSNKNRDSQAKIQIFHPEPHSVNLNGETRNHKENNIEIQQDTLLRQKFKLIPYEYEAEENQRIHQQVQDQVAKQENKDRLQLFRPSPTQLQNINDRQNIPNEYEHQYAPHYSNQNNNLNLEKILREIQLEREAANIRAENIAKSPAVVVHKDINIIRRRPVLVTKHVNIPYPEPFIVPVPDPVEVKVPQPYLVPLEILRHIPVPVVKTETIEVEKPVPYEVEKRVAEITEKKIYVPVEKPYTVERIVPIEVKKQVPVPISVHRPEKFTIIRHVWKH